jgi:hypothetical protein
MTNAAFSVTDFMEVYPHICLRHRDEVHVWMDEHLINGVSFAMFLDILANATAFASRDLVRKTYGSEPEFYALEIDNDDGIADPTTQAMRIYTCALNQDQDTVVALITATLSRDPFYLGQVAGSLLAVTSETYEKSIR